MQVTSRQPKGVKLSISKIAKPIIIVVRSYPNLHVASLLPSVFENLATGLAGDKIWASHLRSPVVLDDVGLQQARALLENLWAVWARHVLV